MKNLATSTIQVASRTDGAGGTVANARAATVAVSGDGTKVGIGLNSGTIVPGLEPRHSTVVLRDLEAPNRTDPVARPDGGEPFVNEGGFSAGGALSADGRYAAILSAAPGLGLPDDVRLGVFVRDRVTGAVVLASRADGAGGAPLPVGDEGPDISADGRRVAFAVGDGQATSVWVRDLPTGRTFLASRADGPEGEPANGTSYRPALDADGSRVAFTSAASNLGDGDGDHQADIHVRDLESGRTILASRGADGAKGDRESGVADINADGTRVAFMSYATNLADGDNDDKPDAHLRDLTADTTRLVSATPDGAKSDGFVLGLSIDASGARVAFDAVATTLPGGTGSHAQVYVRDLAADTLVLASRADGADGAAGPADSGGSVISPDGGHVAFASQAANLVPGTPDAGGRDLRARPRGRAHRAGVAGERPCRGSRRWCDVTERGEHRRRLRELLQRGRAARAGQRLRAGVPARAPGGLRVRRDRTRATPRRPCSPGRGSAARASAWGGRARRSPRRLRPRHGAPVPLERGRHGVDHVVPHRSRAAVAGVHLRRAGRLTRTIGAGPARIALSGRVGRRAMRAGRYRLTLQVRDAAGNARGRCA